MGWSNRESGYARDGLVGSTEGIVKDDPPPLRILATAETWHGANSYSYARGFRRAGHSTSVVAEEWFIAAGWRSTPLKVLRRALWPLIVKEFNAALVREAELLRPHLLFVFKGYIVTPATIEAVQKLGAVAINLWPDVSVMTHGPLIPRTLPAYDWVFTTKTFGIVDMRRQLGVERASFIPHGFDPEVHRPMTLDAGDFDRYACDVSFIGTWSPKKQRLLERLAQHRPDLRLRVWGHQWQPAEPSLGAAIMGRGVLGAEYAKAIAASKINLGILSEVRAGASDGDRITSRTFQIPAAGGFMLHESSDEIDQYFVDGAECATFSDGDDMADKVGFYLAHDDERRRVAAAGRARCLASGHSIDDRVATVVAKARELLAGRMTAGAHGGSA